MKKAPSAPNNGGARQAARFNFWFPRYWGLGGFLLLALTGCARHAARPAADAEAVKAAALPVVQAAPVTTGEVLRTVRVTGTLAPLPNSEARISPPFAAKVARIYVGLNENVQKGQVIAVMATETLRGQEQQARATIAANQLQVSQAQTNALQQQAATRAAIAQARAMLAGAEATRANAAQNFARQQQLYKDGLVAKKDVDDAQAALQTASATVQAQAGAVTAAEAGTLTDSAKRQDVAIAQKQVENARGALATAEAQIALATLHAPLSGVVATLTANNGETLDPATTFATIVDTRDLQLTVSVPARSLRLVHRGQVVVFTTESLPGRSFSGQIASINAQVDPVTGAVPVLVRIHNSSRLLRDDMTATGQIVIERHVQALLIPKTALLTDSETSKTSVVVISPDDVAHVRSVTVGLPSGHDIEITAGLKSGEQVATSGQYALPDGTQVSVQK